MPRNSELGIDTIDPGPMAMGKRKRPAKHDFDSYIEGLCRRFYADDGRPEDVGHLRAGQGPPSHRPFSRAGA